jgi:hypothetical protein
MKRSVTAALNKYKATWTTRYEVNSTIRQLKDKLVILQKTRNKEIRKANTETEKAKVRSRYDDEIKYYDYLLYCINLDYYDIIGKLKNV